MPGKNPIVEKHAIQISVKETVNRWADLDIQQLLVMVLFMTFLRQCELTYDKQKYIFLSFENDTTNFFGRCLLCERAYANSASNPSPNGLGI